MRTKLVCPYCGACVTVPTEGAGVFLCNENGGSCEKTVYALTQVAPGDATPEQETWLGLYKKLTGREWDPDDSQAPMVKFDRLGFLLPNGLVTENVSALPRGSSPQGVLFMAISDKTDFNS